MPVYEYQCSECGQIEEAFQRISDPPLEKCSHCTGSMKKLISQSSFQLKGSGWYVTDYGGSKSGGKESSGSKTSTDSKQSKTAPCKGTCSSAPAKK